MFSPPEAVCSEGRDVCMFVLFVKGGGSVSGERSTLVSGSWSRRPGASWPLLELTSCTEVAEWTERSGGCSDTEDGEEKIRELEHRLALLQVEVDA